jgi:hypothetical protein
MKKHFIKVTSLITIAMIMTLSSCDNGFEELNTNPHASSKIIPEYMFTRAQYESVRNILFGTSGAMQYTTSFNEVAGFGSKYLFLQGTAPFVVFNSGFPNEINQINEVIRAVSVNPADKTKLSMARIWRVYCFHRITDLYGDIPYKDAALGYANGVYKPKYDAQEDIYKDMLKELDEAATAIDPALANFGKADLLYGGNTDQWKKFAYSMMLRLGMRLTKVDIGLAETWVKKAIAGGVITQDSDIAMIKYTAAGQDINKNPLAFIMLRDDYIKADGISNPEGGKFQKSFIDHLQATQDPRLSVIAVTYKSGAADTTAAQQKGMPATFFNKPADFKDYSEPNPKTLLKYDAPALILTNAETNLLLAEAALRGWYNTATAKTLYEEGTKAGLRQWALFGPAGVIADGKINAYLAANPFDDAASFDEQMEQIHTQFWIAIYPDIHEAFANWRRTGYPALVPNNFPNNSTGGQIFRRMLYPPQEENLNSEAYQDAIARQGANTFLTRMWWDK